LTYFGALLFGLWTVTENHGVGGSIPPLGTILGIFHLYDQRLSWRWTNPGITSWTISEAVGRHDDVQSGLRESIAVRLSRVEFVLLQTLPSEDRHELVRRRVVLGGDPAFRRPRAEQ
jgi:hypothetical protein